MDIEIFRLKEIIKSAITPTISLYRKHSVLMTSRNYDNDASISESEINDFLFSIPYFERALSYYLINEGKVGNMKTRPWIDEEWLYNFNRMVNLWAGSSSWLYGPLPMRLSSSCEAKRSIHFNRILLPSLIGIISAC